MLIGSFTGNLGEKRRVAIPRRFLDALGSKLIVTKWYEDCLVLVSVEFWDELFERLTGEKRVKTYAVRDNERFILGSAFEVEPDDQGRIVIPEILAAFANLEKEVVFLGLRDRVEIWSKENWINKEFELPEMAKKSIEQLNKND